MACIVHVLQAGVVYYSKSSPPKTVSSDLVTLQNGRKNGLELGYGLLWRSLGPRRVVRTSFRM
jgi:hypothetical protein